MPESVESYNSDYNNLEKYKISTRQAMLTVMLSVFVDFMGYSLILPLLPGIAKIYDASDFMVGIIISSNAFTALLTAPIWGRLSDKYGRKPPLMVAQAGTLAAFLVLGFSDNIAVIFFSRILDGIFGGQFPIIKGYISDVTTPETRTSEIGKITVSGATAMILGPLIGGFLGALNWRYPIFVACSLSIISIILTWKVLIESMPAERRVDLKLELESLRANQVKQNTIWNRAFVLRLAQRLLVFLITVMFNSSFPLVVDKRYGGGPEVIGLLMTFGAFAAIIYGGILLKRIIRKVGEKRLLLFTFSVALGCSLAYPFLNELWMVFIFIIPFALCMAFMPSLVQGNITRSVDADQQGKAGGWSTNIQSVSQSIAPLIATGYLEIGGLFIGLMYLNAYDLIGYTSALFAIILLILAVVDLKLHPNLYAHERRANKKKKL